MCSYLYTYVVHISKISRFISETQITPGLFDPGIVNINKAFKGSTEILQEMIGHKVTEWILLLGKSPLPHKMQKNNVFFVINRGVQTIYLYLRRSYIIPATRVFL